MPNSHIPKGSAVANKLLGAGMFGQTTRQDCAPSAWPWGAGRCKAASGAMTAGSPTA